MAFDPRDMLRPRAPEGEPAPLAGTRAERVQRLQIGVSLIAGLALLVGLADAITSRAQRTEANAVPEAAPTVVASETSAPRDPLADAGVVPELPAASNPTPTPTPTATGARDDVPPPSNAPRQ
ncbi:hypothetical protein OZN62_05680 [Aurantiacibacter sp. MUD11]|uniref:hypothetical protein n=1 Tax=Aurantiacibacter sp. MUD11 TaxID=3003265 RepID=UPI0022AB29E0|nr:hypothetical protein [Aurantiacibacter sp. MUD11]WAT19054.1 hypothetical protein OZN62_05680 [Aurantiacibacter sp. MUD11]